MDLLTYYSDLAVAYPEYITQIPSVSRRFRSFWHNRECKRNTKNEVKHGEPV